MRRARKIVARTLVALGLLFALAFSIGSGCIDSFMFFPQRATYGQSTPGYVEIPGAGEAVCAIAIGPDGAAKALIRCHGNAEDACNTLRSLAFLADEGYLVASAEYPGYGLSAGSPDEEGCYRNVHLLYDWLVEKRGIKPENIVVDGFSIGTGPATELAASKPVGGLILEAPFTSAPRVVTKYRILPTDPFPNIDRIASVKCPVLVIHGNKDRIVPFSHGKAVFEKANEPKRFIEVDGGGHNTIPSDMAEGEYARAVLSMLENAGKKEENRK